MGQLTDEQRTKGRETQRQLREQRKAELEANAIILGPDHRVREADARNWVLERRRPAGEGWAPLGYYGSLLEVFKFASRKLLDAQHRDELDQAINPAELAQWLEASEARVLEAIRLAVRAA